MGVGSVLCQRRGIFPETYLSRSLRCLVLSKVSRIYARRILLRLKLIFRGTTTGRGAWRVGVGRAARRETLLDVLHAWCPQWVS